MIFPLFIKPEDDRHIPMGFLRAALLGINQALVAARRCSVDSRSKTSRKNVTPRTLDVYRLLLIHSRHLVPSALHTSFIRPESRAGVRESRISLLLLLTEGTEALRGDGHCFKCDAATRRYGSLVDGSYPGPVARRFTRFPPVRRVIDSVAGTWGCSFELDRADDEEIIEVAGSLGASIM